MWKVGKTRAALLLRKFGSLRALRAAPFEEIVAVDGIPEAVARIVFDYLRTPDSPPDEPTDLSENASDAGAGQPLKTL